MKYRKLRIVWSVAWGLVAVLLCVLWVRSRETVDFYRFSIFGTSIHVQSFSGSITGLHPVQLKLPIIGTANSFTLAIGWDKFVVVPHWTAVFTVTLTAVLTWLPFTRFSLRTLLIATTFVAVLLGAVVWAVRG